MPKEQDNKEPEITQNHIDIKKILATKGVKLPSFLVSLLNRLLHVDEINSTIYRYRDKFGIDFANAFVKEDLQLNIEITGLENLPLTGNPIICSNHPLGGPDGVALISAIGSIRNDILFPVNDFLLHLPGLRNTFIPIDKVHKSNTNATLLDEAFASQNTLLYFPAGLCSRRNKHGEIKDLEWKPTVIKKAVKYQRDIVPIHINAQNRKRFYTIANLRKKLGIKFNFEMALLPGEMFAQRKKTIKLTIGRPIPHATFDKRHNPTQWASILREHTYTLEHKPNATLCDTPLPHSPHHDR